MQSRQFFPCLLRLPDLRRIDCAEVKINGRNARIVTAKRQFDEYPYSTQVYIKPALSMLAACKSEKEVALARKVFETIVLHEKKS